MNFIQTNNALKANGHYSQAIEVNGFIFLSGILPFGSETGEFIEGDIEKQLKVVFDNLDSILSEAGVDKNHVIRTTIYIPDIKLWTSANEIYAEYFGDHKPTRSIVPTNTLHFNSNVELEVIACKQP